MRRRLKGAHCKNLQRLHQHNRQQPQPASHTSLAWGVSGASLYQSHTAMFTIASTMLCQLPQCKEKWMPFLGEKTGMKVAEFRTYGRTEQQESKAASEIKVTSQNCSPLMKRHRERILCFELISKSKELKPPNGSRVSVKTGTSEHMCNLRCTSTKHLLELECRREDRGWAPDVQEGECDSQCPSINTLVGKNASNFPG